MGVCAYILVWPFGSNEVAVVTVTLLSYSQIEFKSSKYQSLFYVKVTQLWKPHAWIISIQHSKGNKINYKSRFTILNLCAWQKHDTKHSNHLNCVSKRWYAEWHQINMLAFVLIVWCVLNICHCSWFSDIFTIVGVSSPWVQWNNNCVPNEWQSNSKKLPLYTILISSLLWFNVHFYWIYRRNSPVCFSFNESPFCYMEQNLLLYEWCIETNARLEKNTINFPSNSMHTINSWPTIYLIYFSIVEWQTNFLS